MIAHAGGLPVEEVVPALVSGGGAFLVLLTSLGTRLRSSRAGRQRTNELDEPENGGDSAFGAVREDVDCKAVKVQSTEPAGTTHSTRWPVTAPMRSKSVS